MARAPVLIAFCALCALACSSAPPPESTTPEPEPPRRIAAEPDPPPTEVVELPWEGEVVEFDPEHCQIRRSPILDTSTGVFRRVEIRRGGLELIERAEYRDGPAVDAMIHARGCVHDTVTITFTARDSTPVESWEHHRARIVSLLEALPVAGDPPSYPGALARAIAGGSRDPDTPNVIVYSGDPTVTFDVEAAGDGLVKLQAHYDFPL
jgi:hypothetical protein